MSKSKVIYPDTITGSFIRQLCWDHEVSQIKLAEETGICQKNLNEVILGKTSINRQIFDAVCFEFDLDEEEKKKFLTCISHDYLKYKKLID